MMPRRNLASLLYYHPLASFLVARCLAEAFVAVKYVVHEIASQLFRYIYSPFLFRQRLFVRIRTLRL